MKNNTLKTSTFITAASAALVLVGMVAATANAQQCAALPTGAVSWWQAESNALDSIGGNNGTLNSTGFQLGEVDIGFNFDGSDDYVLVQSTNSNLNIGAGSGITIEGWINPTSVNRQQLLCEWERALGTQSGSDVGVDFAIQPSTQLYADIVETNGTGHELYAPPGLLSTSVWQHVAVTYDKYSGIGTLYINGNAVTNENIGTFTPKTGFTNFLIGARTTFGSPSNPNTLFGGGLDEWTIYNRALYDCEIEAIYNAGSAGKCQ